MNMDIRKGNLDIIENERLAIYCDNNLALIENLQAMDKLNDVVRMEIAMLAVCLKGYVSLYIDGEQYTMKENDLLLCHPNILLEKSMVSADAILRCICLSPEYINRLVLISNNSWDILKILEKTPVITLDSKVMAMFCQYYDLLRSRLTGVPFYHQKEVIGSLIQAFLYEFCDSMECFGKLTPPKYTSGERLLKDFLHLLTSSYPKKRMVSWYADKLHVTPKYLSAVCKDMCGQSPSDIINQYVIKDVQYLLGKSEKSIKEISIELDFPNLSFFGKYVKRHIGLSPKQYREQLCLHEPAFRIVQPCEGKDFDTVCADNG